MFPFVGREGEKEKGKASKRSAIFYVE